MGVSSARWSDLRGKSAPQRLKLKHVAYALAIVGFAHSAAPAAAQILPGAWQFGSSSQHDGRKYFASLRATTVLPTGDETDGYAPLLIVSCTENDPQHWQMQLTLEEPLTSRGMLTMSIKLDSASTFSSQWVVTGDRRTATKVGANDVAKLSGAHRMKMLWNWGWSWLWLSDEAVFELADMRTVLFVLAKSCSVPLPAAR